MDSPLRYLRGGVAWVSRTRWFRRVGPTIMPPFERFMSRISGGRVQASGLLVPSLVLHTLGAKSGQWRESALMYCPDRKAGKGVMLVTGSNFARDSHPAWTANLLKNPDAEVSLHGRRIPVRAQLIGDDELEEVWATIEQQWPGYRGYERASGRKLRIFRLTPR